RMARRRTTDHRRRRALQLRGAGARRQCGPVGLPQRQGLPSPDRGVAGLRSLRRNPCRPLGCRMICRPGAWSVRPPGLEDETMDAERTKTKLETWHAGEKAIQEKAGVAKRMEELGKRVVRDYMPDQHREFFGQLPFIVVG